MLTSNAFEPNGSGSRIVLIDFLRGLCLVVMTIDHLPETLIRKFTLQGFGFFSAAECFVFLSGLVAGRVYGRMAITKGPAVLRQLALSAGRPPLPDQCCIGDLYDLRRHGRVCNTGARVSLRLVAVEQDHALHFVPGQRRYSTDVLRFRPIAPAGDLGVGEWSAITTLWR